LKTFRTQKTITWTDERADSFNWTFKSLNVEEGASIIYQNRPDKSQRVNVALDVLHHGDWPTITWPISLENILNSFAKSFVYTEIVLLQWTMITIKNDVWVHHRPLATYETWLIKVQTHRTRFENTTRFFSFWKLIKQINKANFKRYACRPNNWKCYSASKCLESLN
jgi:hypothetical protein